MVGGAHRYQCSVEVALEEGTWPELSGGQLGRIGAAFYRPLRIVAGVHKPRLDGEPPSSHAEVSRFLGTPIVEWAIILSWLRFTAKVSRWSRG